MYPSNEPFVAQRINGKIVNFPGRLFSNHYPNRRYRRTFHKNENTHLTPQQIFKMDIIHHKLKLIKTIYHLT